MFSEKATNFLWNLHQLFDWQYIGQIIGGDFASFCGLLRIYELYFGKMDTDTGNVKITSMGQNCQKLNAAQGDSILWEIAISSGPGIKTRLTWLCLFARFNKSEPITNQNTKIYTGLELGI